MRTARASLLVLAGVFLAACSGSPTRPEKPGETGLQRQQYLGSIDIWAFDGRVALSDGKDGGSGSLEWQQDHEAIKLEFRGALGSGAWVLEAGPGRAVLQTGKGETFQSADASELVTRHLGWQVPMQALPFWVLGLAAPGTEAKLVLDEAGLPQKLQQLGWEISYNRWGNDNEPVMPVRITAKRGEYSFNLFVRRWRLQKSY